MDFRRGKKYLYVITDSILNARSISRTYEKFFSGLKRKTKRLFKIKVDLLPDKSVGGLVKGVCQVGVSPVRKLSLSSSEQVTQVLFGETFDTLQVEGRWVRVRLDADGYIGWVSSDQVVLFTGDKFTEYVSRQKVYAVDNVLPLFERPALHSIVVREAVFGSQIIFRRKKGVFLEVLMPDNSTAFVKESGVSGSSPVKSFSMKNLFGAARRFQGISYVWGGRSPMGFDCSGFVQTVFRFSGIDLPSGRRFAIFIGKEDRKRPEENSTGRFVVFFIKWP